MASVRAFRKCGPAGRILDCSFATSGDLKERFSTVTGCRSYGGKNASVNQVPPLENYNIFTSDLPLQTYTKTFSNKKNDIEAENVLSEIGKALGTKEYLEHGRLANAHPPLLKAYDRYGNRINEAEFHPSYHSLMKFAMENKIHCLPWSREEESEERPGSHVSRSALMYMLNQVESGVCCPISMTYAVVPVLREHMEAFPKDDYVQGWLSLLTHGSYDGRNIPSFEKNSVTFGMAMTEKQGGSDVQANVTYAIPLESGNQTGGREFVLHGHKWFCSAPMCDAFLTLAKVSNPESGSLGGDRVSCFLVPRWTPNGNRNRMDVMRLKEKMGNRSNASSEIEYNGAWAVMLGPEGRGVQTIIEMVHHTRLDCLVCSSSFMRQATSLAIHHATYRKVFGRLIIEQPIMQNVLADIALETEAAAILAFRVAQTFDSTNEREKKLGRIATAVAKYFICKKAPTLVYEAMECHGGNGYVEEAPLARLYREAPLPSIWEGSGNVICLDVLRAVRKDPGTIQILLEYLRDYSTTNETYTKSYLSLERDIKAMERDTIPSDIRSIVDRMAIVLQARLLLEHSPAFISECFVESRLSQNLRGMNYGTLPSSFNFPKIIRRASPNQ
eukprot:Nk52_evm26s245 gene=Nk52_evmTU26s245